MIPTSRKLILPLICGFLISISVFAQQEKGIVGYNNWLNPWSDFKPNQSTFSEPTEILTGTISEDIKLNKRDIYLLLGDVFVTNNATLSIEPGTIIIGDYKTKGSLTIGRGSKIIAAGTETDPIVFTSGRSIKKAGDWGGLFILGEAPLNTFGKENALNYGLKPSSYDAITYGGDNTESNSGILQYVRIEFAGKRTKDYGYFNGLTLAGVGSQTILENIMVSYCDGNSFQIMGGDVQLNQAVSFRSTRNDYEFKDGTQTKLTNSLAIRNPYISSSDGSRSLVLSSYNKREDADPAKLMTNVVAENITLINVSDDLESDINVGLVQEAIYVSADVNFRIDNSVISGYNPAVILDDNIKLKYDNLSKIVFNRTLFNSCNGNIFQKYNSNNDDLENWYGSSAFNNVYSKGSDLETFIKVSDLSRPDFRLRINQIVATNDRFDDD
ncbi:MAG: hypothetical protein HKN99_10975 [Winogradskyella sp.]|nr:hypothetical protein [Winogradskyella sp.]NNF86068.1 hypothetical protein [Winogradskyella sp.]